MTLSQLASKSPGVVPYAHSNATWIRPPKRRFHPPTSLGIAGWAFGIGVALEFELLRRIAPSRDPHNALSLPGHFYGTLGLVLLLLALAIRPLSKRFPIVMRVRREVGCLAFLYSAIHVFYAFQRGLGGKLETALTLEPLRLYGLLVGVLAFLMLMPLFVTSNAPAMRSLGKRWKPLHRTASTIGILAAVHTLAMGASFKITPLTVAGTVLLVAYIGVYAARAVTSKRGRLAGLLAPTR
jgi:DMSO/TMAO reductase YedYZ heme-binding membrane subunit